MKKVLTVLLTVAMMFCFSATAFAANTNYTDINNCSDAGKSAITKLSALEVLEGKGNNQFDPAGNVTRAEMAKICTILSGKLDVAEKLNDKASDYTDVKVSVWYTGYVNEADALNIVQGDPAGTFRPNDNVTMAEAVAMLLRTAGYTDNLPGPWYIDYLNKAVELGILDDVDFVYNKPATREEIAIMAEALLDVQVVEWTEANDINDHVPVWNNDYDDDQHGYEYTVIQQAFDGDIWYDVVDNIEVVDGEYNIVYVNGTELADGCVVEDAALTDLMGRDVEAIFNEDGEIMYMSIEDEIIEVKEATESNTKVKADGVVYDMAWNYVGDAEDIDDDYYNETGYGLINWDGDMVALWADVDNADMFGQYALVTEVDADDEDEVYVDMHMSSYCMELVEKDGVLTDDGDNEEFIFMKDGEYIEAKDVKAGDVVVLKDNCDVLEVISGLAVNGEVTDFAGDKDVEINDAWYNADATAFERNDDVLDYSTAVDAGAWEALYDAKVDFDYIIGTDNAVQFVIDAETDNLVYAFVTDMGLTSTSLTGQYYVDLYTENGEVKRVVSGDDYDVEDLTPGEAYIVEINDDNELEYAAEIDNVNVDGEDIPYDFVKVNDNNTLTIGDKKVALAKDAVIFNVLDNFKVEELTADDIFAEKQINAGTIETNILYTGKIEYSYLLVGMNDKGEVDFICVTDMNGAYDMDYAIVDAASANYVTVDGQRYEAAANYKALVGQVVSVKVNNGVATLTEVTGTDKTVDKYLEANGMINFTDGTQVELADEFFVAKVNKDGDYEWQTKLTLKAGDNVTYVLNDDGEIEFIAIN